MITLENEFITLNIYHVYLTRKFWFERDYQQ